MLISYFFILCIPQFHCISHCTTDDRWRFIRNIFWLKKWTLKTSYGSSKQYLTSCCYETLVNFNITFLSHCIGISVEKFHINKYSPRPYLLLPHIYILDTFLYSNGIVTNTKTSTSLFTVHMSTIETCIISYLLYIIC